MLESRVIASPETLIWGGKPANLSCCKNCRDGTKQAQTER